MKHALNYILNNQAIGILPLLLAMVVDLYTPYLTAFIVGITSALTGLLLIFSIGKEKTYPFLLVPTTFALIFYSFFFFFDVTPALENYSPLIAEIFFVVTMAFITFGKRGLLAHIRKSETAPLKKRRIRIMLSEAFYIGQIVQNLYTLHLFVILIYILLPEASKSRDIEPFLFNHLGWIIGVLVILYGQIRTQLIQGTLKKETWLPILNDKGHVIGSMARSVSRASGRKFFHPVIRVAVIYNDMLYMKKRDSDEYLSPGLLDYPFSRYVLFRQKMADALSLLIGTLSKDKTVTPRFLIRYTFENDLAKHLVSLYVLCLNSEEQLKRFAGGKLWTVKQIEDNMKAGIFCEYFEKEFPYLKNTVLLAESICCGKQAFSAS